MKLLLKTTRLLTIFLLPSVGLCLQESAGASRDCFLAELLPLSPATNGKWRMELETHKRLLCVYSFIAVFSSRLN